MQHVCKAEIAEAGDDRVRAHAVDGRFIGEIFAVLDAEVFQRCFVSWVAALTGVPAGVIAIDGKTSRGSAKKKGANDAIHMVSAFAAQQRLVLGQTKVDKKSNEIVAIPKLLNMLQIEGAIIRSECLS